MKFTPKQTELINEYKRLEKEYGEGNVFLRYINDYWKVRFIVHKSGQERYEPIYDYKINRKIINALEKNALLVGCNINHDEANSNSCRQLFVGSRIRMELLEKENN